MIDMQDHPLVKHNVGTTLHDYELWRRRWNEEMEQKSPSSGVLLGLLHEASHSSFWYEGDFLFLCLDVACGYKYSHKFGDEGLNWYDGNRNRIWYPRGEVANKAWRLLCDRVFRNRASANQDPSWARFVREPEIFQKLMMFFRVDVLTGNDNVPTNHQPNHRDELALQFLREFVAFAWNFRSNDSYRARSDETKELAEQVLAMFTKARPQFVEILNRIDNLQFLLSRNTDVDEQARAQLKEIALRSHQVDFVTYHSVEEAYADGSKAAETLILLKIRQKEDKRQSKIVRAKRQRQEADVELVKLGLSVE